MNNIKREFLQSDINKLLPIQLLRSSYGLSEVNPQGPASNSEDFVQKKSLTIQFPINSSSIALLVDKSVSPISIVEVRSCPPGMTDVTLSIENSRSYWVYIISKEFKDGYIGGDYVVGSDETTGDRFEASYDTVPQSIDLGVRDRLEQAVSEEEWYAAWDNQLYDGPLIWVPPTTLEGIEGEAGWLIHKHEILGTIDNILKNNDLSSFNITPDPGKSQKAKTIKLIKAMDDIAEFLQDKVGYYNRILGPDQFKNLIPVFEFLNSVLPGHDNYNQVSTIGESSQTGCNYSSYYNHYIAVTNGSLADVVDFSSVMADYVDGRIFHSNVNTRREGAKSTNAKVSAPAPTAHDPQSSYGSEEYGWARGYVSLDGLPVTADLTDGIVQSNADKFSADFRSQYLGSINEKNELLQGEFELKIYDYTNDSATEQADWWNFYQTYASNKYESIKSWLESQITDTTQSLVLAGDSVYQGYRGIEFDILTSTTEEVFYETTVGYNELPQSRPQWFDLTFTSRTTTPPIRLYTYNPDELWNRLTGNIDGVTWLGTTRDTWNYEYALSNLDIDGRANPGLFTPPGLPQEASVPIVEYINENIDRIYTPILETGFTTVVSTGYSTQVVYSTGDTIDNQGIVVQYTAQLGILQNIGYLKKLLRDIDGNMWSTVNNTNSLILQSVIDLKNSIQTSKETNTITNITKSLVNLNNLDISYKMLLDASGNTVDSQWNALSNTKVTDVGNGIISINLNGDEFKSIGKYAISISPRQIRARVTDKSVNGEYIVVGEDLNQYQVRNSFYGWNAQIYTLEGDKIGGQKVVVGSSFEDASSAQSITSGQYLKISPIYDGTQSLSDRAYVDLWSNDFIPVMVDVDIVEHNNLTLSYSMYSKKELNTDTGLCVIYDHLGRPWKELSFGKYSNTGTNGNIIEYRTPEEHPEY